MKKVDPKAFALVGHVVKTKNLQKISELSGKEDSLPVFVLGRTIAKQFPDKIDEGVASCMALVPMLQLSDFEKCKALSDLIV